MGGYSWSGSTNYGPSMMNGLGGFGMMNGSGSSMMRGYRYNTAKILPLTVDQVKAVAEKYLSNLNNSDLKIAVVMIFDNNAYIVVKETSTGRGAFELLVDPVSETAYPEHGPNMMWNLKYRDLNHQNMMGWYSGMITNGGMTLAPCEHLSWCTAPGSAGVNGWENTNPPDVSAEMKVTSEQAIQYAQKYLDRYVPGATAATDPIQFYGYYTIDFEKDDKVVGMLSVNGYTEQVFLHTWHGTFIDESIVE
jgi:hypothetical protein